MSGSAPAALLCLLSLWLCAGRGASQQRYSLYSAGAGSPSAQDSPQRATSRYRNWCAYVVTRVASCVIEDGVSTYVKPEYQPCGWGLIQCARTVTYRSFMRPRYKVAYKMVSEMEWRCCHGYSGDDCSVSLPGLSEEETPRPSTRQPIGSPEEGRSNWDKSRQMEEQIQRLTQQVHMLQSTIISMNGKFQEEIQKGIEGALNGRQPADAASHPDMKETINEIQIKLHQIDNRVREHDGEIDLLNTIRTSGSGTAQTDVGEKLSNLKEELVREVELRMANSCYSCHAELQLIRQQQEKFRQRLRELGRIFNSTEEHNRLLIEGMHKHISGLTGSMDNSCCGETESMKAKVEDVERKLVSLSDALAALTNSKSPNSTSIPTRLGEQHQKQFQDIEDKLDLTERNLKKHFQSHLEGLRQEFGERIQENEERLSTVVYVLGNSTALDDWLQETMRALDEDVKRLKEKLAADGEGLRSVVRQLHELESRVQAAVDGCAQHCSPSLLTQSGQDVAEVADILARLQKKVEDNEAGIRSTGRTVHNLALGEASLRNQLLGFGQEVKWLKSIVHSSEKQMNHVNSKLKDLEDRLQTSVESSFTFCNTVKDEAIRGRAETEGHVSTLTEELEGVKLRFNRFENDFNSSCSAFQIELDTLKEELSDPAGCYKDLLRKIETFNNTLQRYGIVGGSLADLGSMQGELRDVLLNFNSVNNSLKALQSIIHHQDYNMHQLNTTLSRTTNELNADLSRVQEEVTDHVEDTYNKFVIFQNELGKVKGHMVVEYQECKNSGTELEQRVSKLEEVCIKLDSVSQNLAKIKEGLNRHVSSLWNCQKELNTTLQRQSGVLENIKDTHLTNLNQKISKLNHSLIEMYTDIHNIATETGPPGSPGLPGPQGPPGVNAYIERISFSAALTTPQHNPGTILFDKVLVNEGRHYDPGTGIFTAPFDGHYFISAILTGHRNQRIEAVLAKSNVGLARIDSGGFQPEGLENRPVVGPQPVSGSLGIFNIILPLSRGDTVCIDLVTGKLAHSDEPLTIFNGALLYENEDI
ncbi:EMILIN-1b [Narcine bancroftii]|uniref:EMILIN-1b n=1 Tax=Narcine bancroftii TaxID=1343680 RepID=UPI00383113B4